MLDQDTMRTVVRFFKEHPVLNRHLQQTSVCLTGSYAFGLGGIGADIDLKLIAPQSEFDKIRQELIAAGRVGAEGDPEEELTGLVGDYCLEPLERIWETIREYRDLTQTFIYGHIVYVLGNRNLVQDLVVHCRAIPNQVFQDESHREQTRLSEAVYAFLRSFQVGDQVGRLLARSNIIRASMRLAFLTEAEAPPYDKHLFRSLPGLKRGALVTELVRRFLEESQDSEAERYGPVAASGDWHEMYQCAQGTPVMGFLAGIKALLRLT